jgi:hypothetical protein
VDLEVADVIGVAEHDPVAARSERRHLARKVLG